ncbi:hypothetical protein PINS_up006461 [Pythium insidiosum]|nr:hypothetical protein PINS_up006461 [Pythium insidiosum]
MGDLFLHALATDLATTQRVVPPNALFCVPQARSLMADAPVTWDDIATHLLSPAARPTDDAADANDEDAGTERRPGEYETLNGKAVMIVGSHIHTLRGFPETRKVRVLLSEQRVVHHQQIVVLHLSRPLVGGIAVPEDPNEMDVATFRRYTAILRSFPEHELVFLHLDETIVDVQAMCRHKHFHERYEPDLPRMLQSEWEFAVDEIVGSGTLDESKRHGASPSSHSLQIQQVVECYLMEQLHEAVFPKVLVSCRDDDERLSKILYRMRHYGPADFGLRKEFQCYLEEARDELLRVQEARTPLEMLLVFRACLDHINEGVTRNLKRHRHSLASFQLTTDDILDELLFVIIQAYKVALQRAEDEDFQPPSRLPLSRFPLVAIIRYATDYHFINSNTSALGYTMANFQVAVEYFLMRSTHAENCRQCYNAGLSVAAGHPMGQKERRCSQVIAVSRVESAFMRNRGDWKAWRERSLERRGGDGGNREDHTCVSLSNRLYSVGMWESSRS